MATYKHFQLRTREGFIKYAKIELQLLRKEWKILLPCVIMQYVHGVFHNLAYWVQGSKLSQIQRYPLYDLGFELMTELSESHAHWSEYLVFGGVFAPAILLVLSIPLFRQNPSRPRYMVIVLKRVLFHISVALVFRIASFMLTSLPGPARHCRLIIDEACAAANPNNLVPCMSPNPEFMPPSGHEFFTHLDALNGCGDLMFSSHTIYTLSFILTAFKYWPNKYLLTFMVSVQCAIAFLIVAARKHYSLDVFTALYVVPLLWFTHEAYFKDINHKDVQVSVKSIHEFYGVDVSEDVGSTEFHQTTPLESVQVATPEAEAEGNTSTFQRKSSM
ncbi:hypothetical protein PybrP1_006954 [[Pythium] brassicae (nom. inval.)]|nr:hypothetical protein PybrP1_006954 [[Pythium] brassicae (nom. inval.)]